MATISIALEPGSAYFPTSNSAAPTEVQGANSPVPGLSFDGTTQETVFFRFPALLYGSGNVAVRVEWYAGTASSGGVTFGASLACITPNTDTQDVETDGFAAESTASDTHLGTTGKRAHSLDITVSSLDSLAADDSVVLRVRRVPADASDTLAGDAIVTRVIVSYSDT